MVSDSINGSDWGEGFAAKLRSFFQWGKSKATWIVVSIAIFMAIITIILGIAYGLSQEITYEQSARDAHANYSEYTGQEAGQPCNGLVAIKKLNCEREASTEKNKQDNADRRDYADLVAQRSSALWAKIMGIAALIGMGLSLVGVALVWTTFRETRNAAKSAQISSEAYIWNERAWLEFKKWPMNHFPKKELNCNVTPSVMFTNFGRSAAKITSVSAYQADVEWQQLRNPEKWVVKSSLVKPDGTATASGSEICISSGEVKNFIVCIKYTILGGYEDSLECKISIALRKSDSSVGEFALIYENH